MHINCSQVIAAEVKFDELRDMTESSRVPAAFPILEKISLTRRVPAAMAGLGAQANNTDDLTCKFDIFFVILAIF